MRRGARPFSDREIAVIRELWPTPTLTEVIARRLGRKRGVLQRKAYAIGLKYRAFARRDATLARSA